MASLVSMAVWAHAQGRQEGANGIVILRVSLTLHCGSGANCSWARGGSRARHLRRAGHRRATRARARWALTSVLLTGRVINNDGLLLRDTGL